MRCSYSSAKRDSSFRWAFSAALTQDRPGLRPPPEVLRPLAHGSGIQAQFCAAFRCRPARRDDAVGGPSGHGRTAGHAPNDRHRSPSAACLWLQRARQAAGIGRWRASAERWGRHPCAGARQLKGDPAMRLLGQASLRKGQVHQRVARFAHRAWFEGFGRRKRPLAARCPRGAFPNGALRVFLDAWRAYLAKISCIRIHAGDMLPRTGVFPVRGPFGNASGRYLAMARRRMIATEVHRRPISDCNGPEGGEQ